MWWTRRWVLSQPVHDQVLGQQPLRKAAEALGSYITFWRRSPEKWSHLSEVRVAFRDASDCSESALVRVADERVVGEGALMEEVAET